MDAAAGILLAISVMAILIGLFILRYRRELGPSLLVLAGVSSLASSIMYVLISSEILDIPLILPLITLILSAVLLLISILRWRRPDEG